MKWILLPCLSALTVVSFSVFAQNNSDTAFVATAKNYALNLHEAALGTQSRLYNGSRYLDPVYSYEQHPFFESEDWLMGSASYDGEVFKNIPLMYDLLNQVLVAEHAPSGHAIRLINEKLVYFTVEDHYFERIENESVQNSLPATGFYEVLYDGESRFIARRQKFKREDVESREIVVSYESRDRYYIFRNGIYFPMRNKWSLFKIMSDKKQELKRFFKQEGIRYSANQEQALKAAAEYYDRSK